MVRRLVLYFAAFGYVIGVMRYPAFPSQPQFLNDFAYYACIGCPNICPSPGLGALILFGPIQAVIYGIAGFVIGKVVRRFTRPPG